MLRRAEMNPQGDKRRTVRITPIVLAYVVHRLNKKLNFRGLNDNVERLRSAAQDLEENPRIDSSFPDLCRIFLVLALKDFT